jgi:glucose/arabinose dehydrogenase
MNKTILRFAATAILLGLYSTAAAQTPVAVRLQPFVSQLNAPIYVTSARDGTKRMFIVERGGVIKVVQPGSNVPTTFLDISSKTSTDGERGLLGLAFHPSYASNRRFFVYYTRASDGAIRIDEYRASLANPNVADVTEKPIITIPHPGASNHNGGTLAFGPDGYLYAAPGDGGGGNDPSNNAQNINTLLGKMIRIDVNVPEGDPAPYRIPPDNPFAGPTAGLDEIYALGLRNPFRFSFDRGGANQLWLGDVGQNAWEEADIITLGGNYGWRVYEGNACTNLDPGLCNPANFVPPVFEYSSQPTSSRCSITGGVVYRGTQRTLPVGSYIYGDFCTGEILYWNGSQQVPLIDSPDFNLTAFGEDEDGEIYITQMNSGSVLKLVPRKSSADFDADVRTDLSLFRPSNGTWYILNPIANSMRIQQFGQNGDVPAPEDYDGDRRTDLAVFRPSNGVWYFILSATQTFSFTQFGQDGDIPVAGDYDGDGLADRGVFRPSNGTWYLSPTMGGPMTQTAWGAPADIPVPGDYDGDGKVDKAVWRPSNGIWYFINSTNGSLNAVPFGQSNDIPVPGDYDGDGRTDFGVFRPSTGQWFLRFTFTSTFDTSIWGVAGDIPAVGDYDGDGRDDRAVFRPSNGTWYIIRSSEGILQLSNWGMNGDIPLPTEDHP